MLFHCIWGKHIINKSLVLYDLCHIYKLFPPLTYFSSKLIASLMIKKHMCMHNAMVNLNRTALTLSENMPLIFPVNALNIFKQLKLQTDTF